ncbi:nuclear transport factor 2 family protein [Leptospira sp. 201903070]|jgi:uncharacterized protein|uniref:Nuclear transport factor 2 family protein n=1 Tax=Leptospira ainlahdjerensis TaxID=2810033 RepID=A0ABS2U683_9LEPT|nr:nuclear transport factor 2 family protein [Leptospira ainlahdjerensis]MBM9575879.1 nuclear transport factor 2 family protein [Leptospira ainlahdjerensis]
MENTKKSAEVVKSFFNAFGKGDFEGILSLFHDDVSVVAVRNDPARSGLHGSYNGKEGLQKFLTNLGTFFETKAFSVDSVIGEGDVAFASGSFVHKLKTTGNLFSSDWALKCIIRDNRILGYHFYEDSAAFEKANFSESRMTEV